MSSRAAPVKVLLGLALPMVIERASQSVITFADAIQVKDLGKTAIAAVSTGGLNVMGFVIGGMGTVFIVQSFVAQLCGRDQRDQTPRFAWYGLAIALVCGLVAIALVPAVRPALGLTDFSPELQDSMTSYMTIRMTSVAAVVGTEALGSWYGGLGNTWMQMIAGIITMVAAVVLNWVLIGGHLGAPAMGVDGAALASTLASWLGFAFLALAWWRGRGGAPSNGGALSFRELRRVVRFGLPNGFNWFLEFAAFQLFLNGVLSSLGDDAVAALNVVIAVNSLSFMPAFGLASAGAILSGLAIGRSDRDAVWPQVKLTLLCTGTWMGATGVVYLIFPAQVLSLFASEASGNLVEIGTTMLVMSALGQLSDAVSMTLAEALRAAGDTVWTATARLVLAWGVFTPAAFLLVRFAHGGPIEAMFCLVGYLALLAVALAWRFRTGAWRRIELIEPSLE